MDSHQIDTAPVNKFRDLEHYLEKRKKLEKRMFGHRTVDIASIKQNHFFSKLPYEIRTYFSEKLSFKDFINLTSTDQSNYQLRCDQTLVKKLLHSYKCTICDYSTFRETSFHRHRQNHLPLESRPVIYKCEISTCDYSSYFKHNFTRHKLVHLPQEDRPKRHMCQAHECVYRTDYKCNLKTHMHTHQRAKQVALATRK